MSDENKITLEKTITVQDKLIQKYERQIKTLERKISDLEEEHQQKIASLGEEIEDLTTDHVISADQGQSLMETVDENKRIIGILNEQIDELKQTIEMNGTQINQLSTEIKEKAESLSAKEKALGGLEEKVSYLTRDLEEKKAELKQLQEEKIRTTSENGRLQGLLDEYKTKSTSGDTQQETYRATISKLEELLKMKEAEIETLKSQKTDNVTQASQLQEEVETSRKIIGDLQNQVKHLEQTIQATQKNLEETAQENKKMQGMRQETENKLKESQDLRAGIIRGREKLIQYIRKQLEKTASKISITTPNIMDLKDLVEDITKITKLIQIRIATHINPEITQHMEILTHLKAVRNIQIRNYAKEDRWCVEREGTEILLAHGGIEPAGVILEDFEFITLIRNFITEPWITSKIM